MVSRTCVSYFDLASCSVCAATGDPSMHSDFVYRVWVADLLNPSSSSSPSFPTSTSTSATAVATANSRGGRGEGGGGGGGASSPLVSHHASASAHRLMMDGGEGEDLSTVAGNSFGQMTGPRGRGGGRVDARSSARPRGFTAGLRKTWEREVAEDLARAANARASESATPTTTTTTTTPSGSRHSLWNSAAKLPLSSALSPPPSDAAAAGEVMNVLKLTRQEQQQGDKGEKGECGATSAVVAATGAVAAVAPCPGPSGARCAQGRSVPQRWCVSTPGVFTASLVWHSTCAEGEEIQAVLGMLSSNLDLSQVFSLISPSSPSPPPPLSPPLGEAASSKATQSRKHHNAPWQRPFGSHRRRRQEEEKETEEVQQQRGQEGERKDKMGKEASSLVVGGPGVAASGSSYRLSGMICYYGLHYVSMFARRVNNGPTPDGSNNNTTTTKKKKRGEWLVFDDANIRVLPSWAHAKAFCVKSKYQPTVVWFEQVPPGGTPWWDDNDDGGDDGEGEENSSREGGGAGALVGDLASKALSGLGHLGHALTGLASDLATDVGDGVSHALGTNPTAPPAGAASSRSSGARGAGGVGATGGGGGGCMGGGVEWSFHEAQPLRHLANGDVASSRLDDAAQPKATAAAGGGGSGGNFGHNMEHGRKGEWSMHDAEGLQSQEWREARSSSSLPSNTTTMTTTSSSSAFSSSSPSPSLRAVTTSRVPTTTWSPPTIVSDHDDDDEDLVVVRPARVARRFEPSTPGPPPPPSQPPHASHASSGDAAAVALRSSATRIRTGAPPNSRLPKPSTPPPGYRGPLPKPFAPPPPSFTAASPSQPLPDDPSWATVGSQEEGCDEADGDEPGGRMGGLQRRQGEDKEGVSNTLAPAGALVPDSALSRSSDVAAEAKEIHASGDGGDKADNDNGEYDDDDLLEDELIFPVMTLTPIGSESGGGGSGGLVTPAAASRALSEHPPNSSGINSSSNSNNNKSGSSLTGLHLRSRLQGLKPQPSSATHPPPASLPPPRSTRACLAPLTSQGSSSLPPPLPVSHHTANGCPAAASPLAPPSPLSFGYTVTLHYHGLEYDAAAAAPTVASGAAAAGVGQGRSSSSGHYSPSVQHTLTSAGSPVTPCAAVSGLVLGVAMPSAGAAAAAAPPGRGAGGGGGGAREEAEVGGIVVKSFVRGAARGSSSSSSSSSAWGPAAPLGREGVLVLPPEASGDVSLGDRLLAVCGQKVAGLGLARIEAELEGRVRMALLDRSHPVVLEFQASR